MCRVLGIAALCRVEHLEWLYYFWMNQTHDDGGFLTLSHGTIVSASE